VVSVALLADEMLRDILPLDRFAGVSYVVDWPSSTPAPTRFPKSIPRLTGNTEQILAMRPDLVIVSDYNGGGAVAQLASAGVCVARLRAPRSVADIPQAFEELGKWTGTAPAATSRARELREEIARIAALRRSPPLTALVLQGSFTYGKKTLQHSCLELAGLIDAAARAGLEGTPSLAAEQLLLLDPDVVFVSTDTEVPGSIRQSRLSAALPWRALRALRSGRVFELPSSWIGSMSHHVLKACHAYAELTRGLG
jgi:iron complex transport system substrate-binding protein